MKSFKLCTLKYVMGDQIAMADLHNDVTYEGWGKNPAEPHRECMGNSQLVSQRWARLLSGKTDLFHSLANDT